MRLKLALRQPAGGMDWQARRLEDEADAIFGQRMEGATCAVDKMENSILEEMESLDGILIAYCNAERLDNQTHRRIGF